LLTYRACPGSVHLHLRHLAGLLREHRSSIGCRWRKLTPARQALLVLAHLRCGNTFAQLAGSFQVSAVTAYRYVTEAIDILAAAKPDLESVLAARVGQEVTDSLPVGTALDAACGTGRCAAILTARGHRVQE
jgi:Helix-turn-helix of DDE superfamily endonuclease